MSYATPKTMGIVGARPAAFDIIAPSLLAALISGLINIVYTVSFAALIFNGKTALHRCGHRNLVGSVCAQQGSVSPVGAPASRYCATTAQVRCHVDFPAHGAGQ
jgi:hypothetical protein